MFLALTIPDICAKIDNLASQTTGKLYAKWFDKYVGPKYQRRSSDGQLITFLNGADCYALRCAALHEGRDDITQQRARESLDKFEFVAPPKGLVLHCNRSDARLNLQVDIFCRDIASAALAWLHEVDGDKAKQSEIDQLITINTMKDGVFRF